jgi:hypothetical protein
MADCRGLDGGQLGGSTANCTRFDGACSRFDGGLLGY